MDAEALPDEAPPLADPAGVPMPAEPPPEPPASTALASGAAPGKLGIPQTDIVGLSSELANIQRQKIGANERIYGDMERTLSRDQARVEEAYRQTGIGPNDLKPWDNDKAREQFRYDPIEAFGSIGSVFAMVASAFTNRPMENAMYGAAAAMNAVKEGKKEDFERSYKSWQDNTKLAIDRQKIQETRYKDAITLMQTDLSAGQARMQVNAARFGDRQALFLLENGMNKELFELMGKRQDMALQLEQALPKIAIENEKMSAILAIPDPRGSPAYNAKVQQIMQSFSGHAVLGGVNGAELQRRVQEIMDKGDAEGNPVPYSKAWTQASEEIKAANSTVTKGRVETQDVNTYAKELQAKAAADGAPISDVEARNRASRVINAERSTPSGNRMDDIRAAKNQITTATSIIDKLDNLLLKHGAITGLGGTFTRPAEVIGNILGSNETDRVQFLRYVAELKEILPRIITGSNARPLAADLANINRVAAGLSPGDTGANTMRAYAELRTLLAGIDQRLGARMRSEPGSGTAVTAPPPAASGAAAPWANDPMAR